VKGRGGGLLPNNYKRNKKLFNRKGMFRFYYNPMRRMIMKYLQQMLKDCSMSEYLQDEMESIACIFEFDDEE